MIVKSTTYGRPTDPFVRIVDEYQRAGDVTIVNRTVTMKSELQQIVLNIDVAKKPPWWRRLWNDFINVFKPERKNMIPNITIMICAYVVFRCIEAMSKQVRLMRSDDGAIHPAALPIVVAVAGLLCMMAALYVTIDTIETGLKIGKGLM